MSIPADRICPKTWDVVITKKAVSHDKSPEELADDRRFHERMGKLYRDASRKDNGVSNVQHK